jgi:hypothetical protein
MPNAMKKKTRILFFICGVILLWTVAAINSKKLKSESDNYFSNLKVIFSGIVYEKEYLDHGYGIIRINISQTNTINYDVRDSLKRYYCTIKDEKAELIEDYDLNIGDSIYVNGPLRTIRIFTDGRLIHDHQLYGLTGPQDFFDTFRSLEKL